jgi:hypothetical protein
MGMSYFIIPNKKTSCNDYFPDGLSFFFEQIGGYDDKAEVAQVSEILHIDLSVFQDVEYNPEDQTEADKHWHDIEPFAAIVDSFTAKIKAQPDYYKKVIHNPNAKQQRAELSRLSSMRDTAGYTQLSATFEQQPYYYYPPDYGYLSESRILTDLDALRQILACYKKNGVTKIRLEYM